MIKKLCICDRCEREVTEGVLYKLTCYAEDVAEAPTGGMSAEATRQNIAQNMARLTKQTRHLCKACKDELTDGLFIL